MLKMKTEVEDNDCNATKRRLGCFEGRTTVVSLFTLRTLFGRFLSSSSVICVS